MHDEVAAILESLGSTLDGDLPPDLGSPSRTHVFVFDDVVVKINQQPGSLRIERERNALALLSGSDLRVPVHVGDGESTAGRRWIAMTRLDGSPPPDAARPPQLISVGLAAQLGSLVARLHRGPRPPGFGTWSERTYTLLDENDVRVDTLARMGVDAAIVPRSELDDTVALMRQTRELLASAPSEPVLAHRDVQPRNLLVDGAGTLTALLDFEAAGGGDPAEDFRTIALDWTAPGFASMIHSYREAGGPVDDGFAERVTHHVLSWALAVFGYVAGFAPGFLPPAREAVARIRAGERPQV